MVSYLTDGSNTVFEGVFSDDGLKINRQHKIFELNEKGVRVPVYDLNEIEMVNGNLFANKWKTSDIYEIDLKTDSVVRCVARVEIMARKFDFSHLDKLENNYRSHSDLSLTNRDEVLNGIAYNPLTKQLLLTGKQWHFLYEVAIL